MKYLYNDYHIHVVNNYLIRYRVYPESVSISNSKFATSIFDAIDYYALKASLKNGMFFWWYHYKIKVIIWHLPQRYKWFEYILRVIDIINYKKKHHKKQSLK